MEYTITASEDKKYITLKVTGDFRGKEMMGGIIEAHLLGKGIGINRFIVDVTDGKNIDPVINQYKFAYSDMKKTPEVDPQARVAGLVSPGDHSHDFIETVLNNVGLSLKIFDDFDKVLEYLDV